MAMAAAEPAGGQLATVLAFPTWHAVEPLWRNDSGHHRSLRVPRSVSRTGTDAKRRARRPAQTSIPSPDGDAA